ncbi:hypothetical protein O181_042793 [Austropuccinia psidii MF-1]|uniref:Uncharacterized protein n=1 Tax=Austropuccinia psidii MF-1 TaxID=1389203 RepID=A0A9Q3HF33_9BASI|nr:hypothetical protein [Austropuccinia psidii MF-1]
MAKPYLLSENQKKRLAQGKDNIHFEAPHASVTTTKNDPPSLVLRQFQPGTNWPHHILMANLAPSGALWHFGHITIPWPPLPSTPRPLSLFLGLGGSLCLLGGSGTPSPHHCIWAHPFHQGGPDLNGLFGPFRPPTTSMVHGPQSIGHVLWSVGQLGAFWPNPMRQKGAKGAAQWVPNHNWAHLSQSWPQIPSNPKMAINPQDPILANTPHGPLFSPWPLETTRGHQISSVQAFPSPEREFLHSSMHP